jgi:hypothetical protein
MWRVPWWSLARRALVIWAGWTLYALFAASQNFLSMAYSTSVDWKPAFRYAALDAYAWAILTPLVFLVAAKFGIRRRSWWWAVPLQFVASILFSWAHLLLFVRGLPLLDYHLTRSAVQSVLRAKLHSDLLTCWVLIAVRHGIEYYRQSRLREIKAAQLEARLVQAQVQVLKMQLQPHFLFNTLHAISALMYRDLAAADRMMARLSDFLRLTLDSAGVDLVPLKREIEFMDKYLEIEQIRFGERLSIIRTIQPDTLDILVPNLMLQPLVENAIRHSIAPRAAGGRIEIVASRVVALLRITIRDDGPGAAGEIKEGVGLSNIRARLLQLYGDEHRLEMGNDAGGGFRVTLEIPARMQPDASVDRR